MNNLTDNREITEILDILEQMEDEVTATELLKEFNNATKVHGELILNRNPELTHEDWKRECSRSLIKVNKIIEKIKSYKLR